MAMIAAVGQAQGLDAREAGLQAAHQALGGLGSVSPILGIIIAPYRFDPHLVASGVSSLFANMPLIGFSSSAALSKSGVHPNTVVVMFLAGDNIQAESHWFPAYSQAGAETAMRIMQLLGYEQQRPAETVLVFADGLNGNAEEFCDGLPSSLPLLGGLASGDPQSQNSFQIAGLQSGLGGMAAAFLRGNIKTGIGHGHGWHPVGSRFRITRSRGFWVRTLDGRPASESYARMFGRPAREWSFPPLNYLTRIYPLGFEQAHTAQLKVRAPVRVEADGSFRMNALLRDGSDGYLLIGSPADCYIAAKEAARTALESLGNSKPAMALILVDAAWQTILEANPGAEIQAVREVLGEDLPIAGGYTLGQIVSGDANEEHPIFLNQHILVILFSEK